VRRKGDMKPVEKCGWGRDLGISPPLVPTEGVRVDRQAGLPWQICGVWVECCGGIDAVLATVNV
jgi:hypothetical protein